MKISLEWLNEYVDLSDISVEQIVHELTMSGLEVEDVEKIGPKFSNIVTAKILKIDNHPNADKLHLVQIDNGKELKTVVCGAQNIEEGQIIPYASVGSKVFSRKTGELFELTPAVIRGVESQGMLCSADELGLSEMGYQKEDGILILNRFLGDLPLGKPLEEVLNIQEDIIFNAAPTTNRGDEMSMVGVARELCSIFNKKLHFSHIQCDRTFPQNSFKVEIKDNDVCKYYSIGVLKDIEIKPSPDWMQRRLVASGIRAINNVVDITNYVLLEYGTPLHAFDLDKLDGYLCVRRANEGETLVTLDEVERKLTHDSVLIATQKEPVCAGGVFGGANSEIDENSKNIALEAAYFVPAAIRRSARSIGYRSEAAARFERGVDIEEVKPALMRAIQLMTEFANAKVEDIVETGENKMPDVEITLRFQQVERMLGCKIEPQKCIEIITNLGFELLGQNELAAKFKVPSFRMVDVYREIDLIEEIARINGFDKIAPTLPKKTMSPEISDETKILKKINSLFLGMGFDEIMTSSFVSDAMYKEFLVEYDPQKTVKGLNACSEDNTMLRQSIIPSILQTIKYNHDNGQKNLWVYETGKTYSIEQPATQTDTGVKETRFIGGAIYGSVNNEKWNLKKEPDFYTLKGVMENLFGELGLSNRIQFKPTENVNYLHPKRSASITVLGKVPAVVATFGQLHPIIKEKQKFTQDVFVFEVNLDLLLSLVSTSFHKYKKFSQFPEVQRDIAFVVPKETTCDEMNKIIKKSVSPNLFNGAELFDIYQGEHIQEGFKSVAYRIKLQDKTATLTDEMIETEMKKLREGLTKNIKDVVLR